jgi:glycosyltransferase involved in cell wall biosynthesis
VVIPAYNEAATIREVAARALRKIENVIVVDDGSTDGTADALVGLPVIVLRNPTNCGKAASLWRGFQYALGAGVCGVVTLDGDAQHAPEEIRVMAGGLPSRSCDHRSAPSRQRRGVAALCRELCGRFWISGLPPSI